MNVTLTSSNGKISMLFVNEPVCPYHSSFYYPDMSLVSVESFTGTKKIRLDGESYYCFTLYSHNLLQSTTVDIDYNLTCEKNTISDTLSELYLILIIALSVIIVGYIVWQCCKRRQRVAQPHIHHVPLQEVNTAH